MNSTKCLKAFCLLKLYSRQLDNCLLKLIKNFISSVRHLKSTHQQLYAETCAMISTWTKYSSTRFPLPLDTRTFLSVCSELDELFIWNRVLCFFHTSLRHKNCFSFFRSPHTWPLSKSIPVGGNGSVGECLNGFLRKFDFRSSFRNANFFTVTIFD